MTCLLVEMLHKHCHICNFTLKSLFLCLIELYITMDKLFRCVPIQKSTMFPHLLISFGFPADTQIRVTTLLFQYPLLAPFPAKRRYSH